MSELWITALTSGGSVALLSGVIQAFVGRRKLSADATRVIEESASSAVERVERDNDRLRKRLDKVEELLDEFRKELRSRDVRIDDLSADLNAFREYSIELRDELLRQDPNLTLPEPPSRIASHFLPAESYLRPHHVEDPNPP